MSDNVYGTMTKYYNSNDLCLLYNSSNTLISFTAKHYYDVNQCNVFNVDR